MRITERGLRYVESALNNWYIRENKLKEAWCSDHEFIGICTTDRQRRLLRIANELRRRIDFLLKYRHDHLGKIKEEKMRSDYEHVIIQCHYLLCKTSSNGVGVGRGLYRKDYVPGEHKCAGCGNELMTYEEWQVERQIRYQQF